MADSESNTPNPVGHPTDFRQEYVQRILEMAANGAIDTEIADEIGVSVRTLYRWKAVRPELSQALKIAKEQADERVERSLFQRATGYERDSVKVFMDKNGQPVYAPFREDVQPDTTACIFWLKNRKKEDWRDKVEHEHAGADGGPIQSAIAVTFVRTSGNTDNQG